MAGYVPFEERSGKLMEIIRSVAQDWPTAEQALIDFPYAKPWKASTTAGQPGWWSEVEDAPTLPDTFVELEMATAYGMLTREQFNAVHAACWAKDHPFWQPGDEFAPDGRSGYRDEATGEFVERTGPPKSAGL